jgi:hypothetical protein
MMAMLLMLLMLLREGSALLGRAVCRMARAVQYSRAVIGEREGW